MDIENGQMESLLDDVASPTSEIKAVTSDGKYALVSLPPQRNKYGAIIGSEKAKLGVWNLQQRKLDYIIPWEFYLFVDAIAVTSDNRYVVKSPGYERWDLQKQEMVVVS